MAPFRDICTNPFYIAGQFGDSRWNIYERSVVNIAGLERLGFHFLRGATAGVVVE